MRRTDNARVIHTAECPFQTVGTWAETPTAIRRGEARAKRDAVSDSDAPGGSGQGEEVEEVADIEVQQRLLLGQLPIAYRCAACPSLSHSLKIYLRHADL